MAYKDLVHVQKIDKKAVGISNLERVSKLIENVIILFTKINTYIINMLKQKNCQNILRKRFTSYCNFFLGV